MATYVVTGVSKGIGFEILRQVSSDPSNTVIGVVRDKPSTEKKVSEELPGRKNIHILTGDLVNYDELKKAAADTAAITGGAIDYLIANAGYVSTFDGFDPISVLGENPQQISEETHKLIDTNVIGNVNLYNLFVPLILKGNVKKVVCITSGMADLELSNRFGIPTGAMYAASKAAMNVITAKFNAEYGKQGVLFLGICPGMVDVGHFDLSERTPQQLEGLQVLMGKFQEYSPTFSGPTTPENAVKDVKKVWEDASLEKGYGGAYISHLGNKQWL